MAARRRALVAVADGNEDAALRRKRLPGGHLRFSEGEAETVSMPMTSPVDRISAEDVIAEEFVEWENRFLTLMCSGIGADETPCS